jgi:molybdopterin-containing oxidoreductase family membrane subunit
MISITALTNLNNAVPWGLWVSIYIFLVGVSAGVLTLIAWGNLQGNPHLKKITRMGLTLALSALLAGLLSIQIDLGHIERFYKLFTSPNPSSVMDLMVWLYGVYFAIIAMLLLRLKRGISKSFFVFSLVFALVVIVLESLLFARPPGKHWHSLIFPIHFFTSSLVSAISVLLFIVGILWIKDKKGELLLGLSKIALLIILINLIVEIIDIFSFGSVVHLGSWVLLSANFIAIALLRKRSPVSITIAGCIGLIVVLSSKYNGLISTQKLEPFKGFAKSYIEPRLMFSYTPNGFEFFVAILLISLAAGLFYFLYRIFPLTREE